MRAFRPMRPTLRMSPMCATPVETQRKTMGAMAMRISLIKRSPSGFMARACLGSKMPRAIAATIATKTCRVILLRSFFFLPRGVSCVSVANVFLAMVRSLVVGKRLQQAEQLFLGFKPNARRFRQRDVTLCNGRVIGKSAKGLKYSRVRFISAESQSGSDVQRQLMPAVRNAATRGPTVLFQHVQNAHVLDQAVAQRAIKLQNVAIRAHARIADQVSRILNRKKIFARGHRILVMSGQLSLQLIIERIARFFVPSQIVGLQGTRVSNRRLQVETSVRIHCQLVSALQNLQHSFDTAQIFGERCSADLHLHYAITHIEISLHLFLQGKKAFFRSEERRV